MTKLTFLLLLCSSLSYGQGFAPVGSYWNYQYWSTGLDQQETYKVVSDSMINGAIKKQILITYDRYYSMIPGMPVGQGTRGTTEMVVRNDTVYYGGGFVYYNQMMKGDTIKMPFTNNYAVVDSIEQITVNGRSLKKWHLVKHCSNWSEKDTTVIIEDIGPINDFFNWMESCNISSFGYYFECYQGDSLQYNPPCKAINLEIKTDLGSETDIQVFPQPFTNRIILEPDSKDHKGDIIIQAIDGKVVYKLNGAEGRTPISTSGFEPGLYVLRFTTLKRSYQKQIIKI